MYTIFCTGSCSDVDIARNCKIGFVFIIETLLDTCFGRTFTTGMYFAIVCIVDLGIDDGGGTTCCFGTVIEYGFGLGLGMRGRGSLGRIGGADINGGIPSISSCASSCASRSFSRITINS